MDKQFYPAISQEGRGFVADRSAVNSGGLYVADDELFLWPQGPQDLCLGCHEVHVWAVSLDLSTSSLARFARSLSAAELNRAARFRFAHHRDRFIAGHGWLRFILGCYTELSPSEIQFKHGPYGKPRLSHPAANGIEFNLAHSENLGLVAVTRCGPVGVDIEQIRMLEDYGELVRQFFSPRENALFLELDREQQALAFFNLWTRKEAFLKATGQGISQYLKEVEVSFLPDEPASLRGLPEHFQFIHDWLLQDLMAASGFAGALATAATHVACWHCREEKLFKMT